LFLLFSLSINSRRCRSSCPPGQLPDDGSNTLPQNIREFNQIILVVFSQLFLTHPLEKTLDPAEIAEVIGVSPTGTLPSKRGFAEVFVNTMRWLHTQGFTNTYGSHAHQKVTLTARALDAMNAVPPALKASSDTVASLPAQSNTGTVMVVASEHATHGDRKHLVDLAGSLIGSVIESAIGS
jgi:hypothetical protein